MSGALRGVPAQGVGAYLLANSAAGGVAPSQKKQLFRPSLSHKEYF